MSLMTQLEAERERAQQCQDDCNKLSGEVEELTSKLFDEANKMVAKEVKQRVELEGLLAKAQEETRQIAMQLEVEREQLKELRARFQQQGNREPVHSSFMKTDGLEIVLDTLEQVTGNQGFLSPHNMSYAVQGVMDRAVGFTDGRLLASFKAFLEVQAEPLAKAPFFARIVQEDAVPCLPAECSKTHGQRIIAAMTNNRFNMEQSRMTKMPSCSALVSPSELPQPNDLDTKEHPFSASKSVPNSPVKKRPSGSPRKHLTSLISNLSINVISPTTSGSTAEEAESSQHCSVCKYPTIMVQPHFKYQIDEPKKHSIIPYNSNVYHNVCFSCGKRLMVIGNLIAFLRNTRKMGLLSTGKDYRLLFLECQRLRRVCAHFRIAGLDGAFFVLDDGLAWSHVLKGSPSRSQTPF